MKVEPQAKRFCPPLYPICVDLHYKVISSRRPIIGAGRTTRVGSHVIEFEADQPVPPGSKVELSVCWPVLLDNRVGLQLVLSGWVAASEGNSARVEFERYHFRTRRTAAPGRQPAAAPRPVLVTSSAAARPLSVGAFL